MNFYFSHEQQSPLGRVRTQASEDSLCDLDMLHREFYNPQITV